MRIAVVVLIFIVSLFVYGEATDVFAKPPMTRRDSIALAERRRAFADFERGIVDIPNRGDCNYFYAEEILFKRCGIKADMYRPYYTCGTGMEEVWFKERCYEGIIDSLMFASFGRDIYERINVAGGRLQKLFPKRYPDDNGLRPIRQLYDQDSVAAILAEYVTYPPAAKKDKTDGEVQVRMEYDSSGTMTAISIMSGVRADLDSAAMAGATYIRKVNPEFRWGQHQPGMFVLPIKFKLKD